MTFEGLDAAPLIVTTGSVPAMAEAAGSDAASLDAALRDLARAERAAIRVDATMLDLWVDNSACSNLHALERPALGAGTSWHAWAATADDGEGVLDLAISKSLPLFAAFGDEEGENGGPPIVVKGTRDVDTGTGDETGGGYGDGSYGDGGQSGGGVGDAAAAVLISLGPEGSDAEIWVKAGADISNLSAEVKVTFAKIVAAFKALGLPHPVITSGRDGDHGTNSLHYAGQALDFRGNNITDAQGIALQDYLRNSLGSDYDVIFETFADPSRDHLHIEFDPD